VPRSGLEPLTLGLEVLCSIQLSYQGKHHYCLISLNYNRYGSSIAVDKTDLDYYWAGRNRIQLAKPRWASI
jgi:hypothetical protein